MDNEYWMARWRDRLTGWHQQQINAHLQEFWGRLGCAGDERVFVPLCGKSLDMLWLRGRGHPVLGVEVSPLAVAEFFAENRLRPTMREEGPFRRHAADGVEILCGDLFALAPEQLADVAAVYDRASLIALTPELRGRYVETLQGLLPAAAEILLVTMEYDQRLRDGPPFAVHRDEVEALYGGRYRIERLFEKAILDEHPHYRDSGIEALHEVVYHLLPRRAA